MSEQGWHTQDDSFLDLYVKLLGFGRLSVISSSGLEP